MASRHLLSILTLIFLLNTNICLAACYPRIFSFGDSLTDTGNYRSILLSGGDDEPVLQSPYGETYFHRPTGRFCDGRLIVDFLAESLGLPLLPPYLPGAGKAEYFNHGANFAVGGVTALNSSYFRSRGLQIPDLVGTLSTQLEWFKDMLNLLCSHDHHHSDCKQSIMEESLFLVGEIGGNDYNLPFEIGTPFETIRTFVPDVIAAISSAITELIHMGAKTLVVPGELPIGCIPMYLIMFQSSRGQDYEPNTGCIEWLNDFAKHHDDLLLQELVVLRQRYPNATIIYADYFGAAMDVFLDPLRFGFSEALVVPCCGKGGPCSMADVCDDPRNHTSWDGMHPTEAAYKAIADGLLKGTQSHPPILSASCLQVKQFGASVDNIARSL